MKSSWGKVGIILAVVAVTVFGFKEAGATDWRFYGRTDNYSCFYDLDSINFPSGYFVEVSEKQDYTKQGVSLMVKELGEKYENLSHLITLWRINCSDRKFRFLAVTYYSKEGRVIYSWKVLYSSEPAEEWSRFVPGSLGERLYKAVCK